MKQEKCIVYLETSQSKIIKVLFEVLKEVLMGNANLIFSKSGIQLKIHKKKSIVFLNLHGNEFEEYLCDADEFIAGIDTTNFHKITKSINSKDSISIYIESDDPGTLHLVRVNSETESKYSHKIKLCNVPYNKLNIPPATYYHSLIIKSVEFQTACKHLNSLNCEFVDILFKQNSIVLSSDNDFSETNVELKQQQESEESSEEEKVLFDSENEQIVQGNYSLQYILLFTKATTLDKNFEIFLNSEKPLTMSYAVGSLGHLDFMLEPNFDDSDSEFSSDSDN